MSENPTDYLDDLSSAWVEDDEYIHFDSTRLLELGFASYYLVAALREVLSLHVKSWAGTCIQDNIGWPCPTRRAIEAELVQEQGISEVSTDL